MPSDYSPGTLLILDPNIEDARESRCITNQINLDKRSLNSFDIFWKMPDGCRTKLGNLLIGFPQTTQDILAMIELTEAQVVVTRKPRMIPLCAPTPCLEVATTAQTSTAGVFCRDNQGVFWSYSLLPRHRASGYVSCRWPEDSHVKYADQVQDIVFIPLGEGYNCPTLKA